MLNAIITKDDLEQLPEPLRSEYAAGSGDGQDPERFYLQVKPVDGYALEDVVGLKTVLGEVKGERTTLREKLAVIGDMDIAEAKKALKQVQEWGENPPADKDKLEKAVQQRIDQLQEKHNTELKSRDEMISKRTSQIHEIIVDSAINAALAKQKLVEGGADLLRPHVRGMIKVTEDNGVLTTQVVDPKGNPRISQKQGSTDHMDVDELVGMLSSIPTYAPAFAGSGGTGSGATGGTDGGGGGGSNAHKAVIESKSPVEALRAARAVQS